MCRKRAGEASAMAIVTSCLIYHKNLLFLLDSDFLLTIVTPAYIIYFTNSSIFSEADLYCLFLRFICRSESASSSIDSLSPGVEGASTVSGSKVFHPNKSFPIPD